MTAFEWEIIMVGALVAAACALPGTFLVLRKLSMMSDAITHTVLLGIVLAFFWVQDLSSPVLIGGAALVGVLTVYLVELLKRSRRVAEDAAIGLVFPFLFSIAIILISRFAGSVHLDTDAVLLGELALVPQDRLILAGRDLGPRAAWIVGVVGLAGAGFIVGLFKELKLSTFDPALAEALGFKPALLSLGLMGLVSLTAVAAFDAVGSVLVVALMIGPPAAALLLTNRLEAMLVVSVVIGIASAPAGYLAARRLDVSIAGSMAVIIGVAFVASLVLAPRRGLLAVGRRRIRQKWEFAQKMLTAHLFNHEGTPEQQQECRLEHLEANLGWDAAFRGQVVDRAASRGLVVEEAEALRLTESGRDFARQALVRR
ncbi:MAG: metal ABC transporter permease [Actinomycetota bacterium]